MDSVCGCGRARVGPFCQLADARVAPSWPADSRRFNMLPDVHRMRTSGDFTATVRAGVRASRPCVVVHARASQAPTRIGFVVSKAVGNAVVRNRVKRRLRHSVRGIVGSAAGGPDPVVEVSASDLRVVVRALPRSGQASYRELDRELSSAWRQAENKLLARTGGAQR